jgi:hypothetical protein
MRERTQNAVSDKVGMVVELLKLTYCRRTILLRQIGFAADVSRIDDADPAAKFVRKRRLDRCDG